MAEMATRPLLFIHPAWNAREVREGEGSGLGEGHSCQAPEPWPGPMGYKIGATALPKLSVAAGLHSHLLPTGQGPIVPTEGQPGPPHPHPENW